MTTHKECTNYLEEYCTIHNKTVHFEDAACTDFKSKRSMKQACAKMNELIESCWDQNNPNDGSSFEERLHQKMEDLSQEDKDLLDWILRFE